MKPKCKFKIGDKVVLIGCPFDEQQGEEAMQYARLRDVKQTVMATSNMYHDDPDASWLIGTDACMEWIAEEWFKKVGK